MQQQQQRSTKYKQEKKKSKYGTQVLDCGWDCVELYPEEAKSEK